MIIKVKIKIELRKKDTSSPESYNVQSAKFTKKHELCTSLESAEGDLSTYDVIMIFKIVS